MRIISLNTWGGRAGKEKLLDFFKKYADTTDIFCLQEIWAEPYPYLEGCLAGGVVLNNEQTMVYALREISAVLPNHATFFRPLLGENYGLLMLVRKEFQVSTEGEFFVYKQKGYSSEIDIGDHARSIQYVTIATATKPLTVINFHGLWNGKGKTDTEERIQQSKNILEFTSKLDGEYVLCGDFNLLPDTESVKLFERAGLRNLIKEYGVLSTRTSFYTKSEKYADYVFVTKGVQVKDFKVLPDEVSDHAPLVVDL
ncbi:MAG: endonuclease/exonuclease/phosphatase family protein [Candidatus Kaiserbacteria bacterium]|nr:endonuclease/exonuclease/phosphatase family protein [Candidatus Kaiserbacteria bacterium]